MSFYKDYFIGIIIKDSAMLFMFTTVGLLALDFLGMIGNPNTPSFGYLLLLANHLIAFLTIAFGGAVIGRLLALTINKLKKKY
jgi:ABC-type dipeptide/oligopeptide/nickel transport system permease subunit